MSLLETYLGNDLALSNAITGFAVVQAVSFTYWSQTKDFENNVETGGHWWAAPMIAIFVAFYVYALRMINLNEVDLLRNATPLGFNLNLSSPAAVLLIHSADSGFWEHSAVVVAFNLLCLLSLLKYFLPDYRPRTV